MALLNAFNGWTDAMSQSRGKEFVQQRYLHWGTLNMIRGKYQTSSIAEKCVKSTLLAVLALLAKVEVQSITCKGKKISSKSNFVRLFTTLYLT